MNHQICKVIYEVLIYSGNMPEDLGRTPSGVLLCRVQSLEKGSYPRVTESGEASYFILLVNGIPCSFGVIGREDSSDTYDISISDTFLTKGNTIMFNINKKRMCSAEDLREKEETRAKEFKRYIELKAKFEDI